MPDPVRPAKLVESFLERGIFASRWLLLPIYLGMIAAQAMYTVKFLQGLWHLWHQLLDPATGLKPEEAANLSVVAGEALFLQSVLGLVDFLMVANLIVMVVIGGYATFVSKLDLDDHTDRPAWLDHIDPGTLKTKLAGALIGVSGIHLLQTFTTLGLAVKDPAAAGNISTTLVMWQVIIHLTFVVSTIILAYADLLLERKLKMAHGENVEHKSP
jgi:uncharacterized protein (TIGR00645 family)